MSGALAPPPMEIFEEPFKISGFTFTVYRSKDIIADAFQFRIMVNAGGDEWLTEPTPNLATAYYGILLYLQDNA